ncbi:MAG: YidC/Oxa1 family membrane protein insertase [Lachnospiraceae bacterium]|nr:YidC/Oxa1 family membrane protein insertase [Lachnospiraceae bacterium]
MLLATNGGILGPVAQLLGYIIEGIYNGLEICGIQNIGLSIILFTLVVKIILFPLTLNQQRFTKVNQIMQPEMNKIQKKYRNRRDNASMLKQQEEMNALYEKYGASPTAGCLPLLVQMPILLALYRVVMDVPTYIPKVYNAYKPVAEAIMGQGGYAKALAKVGESVKLSSRYTLVDNPTIGDVISYLAHMPNEAWDLIAKKIPGAADVVASSTDKLIHMNDFILGINITQAPGFRLSVYMLIPILAAGAQYLSARVSMGTMDDDNPAAATSKQMMLIMPIMSFVMCISLPSAIGIYWAASAIFTVLQQWIINYYYDHADMDKIIEKQRAKAAKKKAKKKGKPTLTERMMQAADPNSASQNTQAGQGSSANSKVKSAANINTKKVDANYKNKKGGSISSKANIVKELDKKGGQ